MYVAHLSLHHFRSYDALELELGPGVTAFVGSNGQGKTNIVEAVDYLSRLTSHRVASDAPLVKQGEEQAVVRASVVKDGRPAVLEVEINPGRCEPGPDQPVAPAARPGPGRSGPHRALLSGGPDPGQGRPLRPTTLPRRPLVLRTPRLGGVRADYDRVLRQRNALLKNAAGDRRRSTGELLREHPGGLGRPAGPALGAELVEARATLVDLLGPLLGQAYTAVAKDASRTEAVVRYVPSVPWASPEQPDGSRDTVATAFRDELARRRTDEVQRGLTLVGPHRDELALSVGTLPVKGYASHGESWSCALALRLASYDLLRADGDDPILILDDVFAELDTDRRERLAELVAGAEQVLVTAAVGADVPTVLEGTRIAVRRDGAVG